MDRIKSKLPHSESAERSMIAALLLDPSVLEQFVGVLQPEHFFNPQLGRIWQYALNIRSAGKIPEPTNLIDAGSDISILTDLSGDCSSVQFAPGYCDKIVEKSNLRRLVVLVDEIRNKALSDGAEPNNIISEILERASDCYSGIVSIETVDILAKQVFKECEQRQQNPNEFKPMGVTTGLTELDAKLTYNGIARGNLTMIAGKSGAGKSALAQTITRNAAKANYKGIVFSFEDSSIAQVTRAVSAVSGLQNRQLQQRVVGVNEWKAMFDAQNQIKEWGQRIKLIDEVPDSVDELITIATREVKKNDLDFVVFDYLQLIDSGKGYSKQQQHTDYIVGRIQRFAKKQRNCATVLVSQMRRHEGRPNMEMLLHSGKIEQSAHTILLVWAPDLDDWPRNGLDCRMLDLAKQKNGSYGLMCIGWNPELTNFYDADKISKKSYGESVRSFLRRKK